jgi:hypothetical protein
MGVEWKRLTMQNGAWVATVTALSIGAGALLWYERPAPLYPTTRDEAEARFALLERWVATRGYYSYGWGNLETVTNMVGFYPSRWFWTKPRYEAEWSVPALTWAIHGASYNFIDLWGLGGVGGLQRPVAEYEFVVADADKINFDWWKTNMYAAATRFGDYQYLHTNTLYMCTNILEQVGRALSAMRWTLEAGNHYIEPGPGGTGAATVEWYSHVCIRESLADAFTDALDAWEAAAPSEPLDGVTNCPLRDHTAYVDWEETYTNTWKVWVTEQAYFVQRMAWVPAATNVTVWHVGAFGTNAFWDIDEFYHPFGVTGTWEIASVPLTDLGGGTKGFPERLFDWHGRIPRAEIAGLIPPMEEQWYGRRVMGWARHNTEGYGWFAGDWRFQCFTNRAAFWD